jgi:hypothetical protein
MKVKNLLLRARRIPVEEFDYSAFHRQPLPADALRAIRYMHDVEDHTACYLRDLLVTRAHKDPEITAFLSTWAYEEHWHGEALGEVLSAHGEPDGTSRTAALRKRLGVRDHLRPLGFLVSSLAVPMEAIAMAWGLLNELSTQAGYAMLARKAAHPELTRILSAIMRQEGRHIDFYGYKAKEFLGRSKRVAKLVRWALEHLWSPVGSGVMAEEEVRFLAVYLFSDNEGANAARRIDAHLQRIPGLSGIAPFGNALRRYLRG